MWSNQVYCVCSTSEETNKIWSCCRLEKGKNSMWCWRAYQLLKCPFLELNFFVAPRPWSQSDAISVSNLSDGAPEPSTSIKAVRQTFPRRPIVLFLSSRPLPSYWMRALKTALIWTIKHKGGTCFMASLICMRKYWEIYFKCLAVSGFRAGGGPGAGPDPGTAWKPFALLCDAPRFDFMVFGEFWTEMGYSHFALLHFSILSTTIHIFLLYDSNRTILRCDFLEHFCHLTTPTSLLRVQGAATP